LYDTLYINLFQFFEKNKLIIIFRQSIMTYSYIYGNYFYLTEVIDAIDKVEIERRTKRLNGETLDITFANQLKNLLQGIESEKVIRMPA